MSRTIAANQEFAHSRVLAMCFLGLVSVGLNADRSSFAAEANRAISVEQGKTEGEQVWYAAHTIGVEGQAFSDVKSPFDRLPKQAEGVVRGAVWGLSQHSAGLCVRFETDSSDIRCRWTLTSSQLAMPHMPATGVSGVDLYVKHEGQWRWLACGFPRAQENSLTLASGIASENREYMLYLPLYNGVKSLEIGLPKKAKLSRGKPRAHTKPIVFYGTSITQGGCASRPGMVHTAILGRWLNRPVVNLGFSGNGRMELEVARFMNQIDAEVFVIDCLPNLNSSHVAARTIPLVESIRAKHPKTPILLVEDRNYSNSFLLKSKDQRNKTNQAALRAAYEKLRGSDENLHYLEGANLLGDDNEGTVDSSHPTDLGFYRQAQAFRAALEPILK